MAEGPEACTPKPPRCGGVGWGGGGGALVTRTTTGSGSGLGSAHPPRTIGQVRGSVGGRGGEGGSGGERAAQKPFTLTNTFEGTIDALTKNSNIDVDQINNNKSRIGFLVGDRSS